MELARRSRAGLRRTAAVATLGLAATLTGVVLPGTAVSAPSDLCPDPFPIDDLAKGDAVEGLTVTSGTVPTSFTGTIKGVLADGIAPDVDMILADLDSPELDRVGGIWEGMSGSPVYAADGRLIGAVAYGLSWGASKVAGITPAAAMYELRSDAAAAPQPAARVAVPRQQRAALRSAGATERQINSGFRALPLPYGVSGLGAKRLQKAADKFGFDAARVFAGSSAPAASATPPERPVPGGNVAASLSYGDVSYVGTGTVTAVCGDEVIGFGHPMNFSGPTTLTMHNADAIYVQEDTTGAPFKVANPSAPVGTIDQDRNAGILGPIGPTPATTPITSTVSMRDGSKARTGRSFATFLPAMGDIAATHLMSNLDRVYDGWRAGSAEVGWTIRGKRPNGSAWTFTHADHWTDRSDITFVPASMLYEHVEMLRGALGTKGTIDSITMNAKLSEPLRTWSVVNAEVRRGGKWIPLKARKKIKARPGAVLRVRATLSSAENNLGRKVVRMKVRVPKKAKRTEGTLYVASANQAPLAKGRDASGVDKVIAQLRRYPKESDLVAAVTATPKRRELVKRTVRNQGARVTGGKRIRVVIARR